MSKVYVERGNGAISCLLEAIRSHMALAYFSSFRRLAICYDSIATFCIATVLQQHEATVYEQNILTYDAVCSLRGT